MGGVAGGLLPFLLGCAVASIAHLFLPALMQNTTTTGRPKASGDNAFVLRVGLQFTNPAAASTFVSDWSKAAAYCMREERFLFHYEVSQSDKFPLQYMIVERYRSKRDYVDTHRHSKAFAEFRPKLKALQDNGEVTVTGDSWIELGVGFT